MYTASLLCEFFHVRYKLTTGHNACVGIFSLVCSYFSKQVLIGLKLKYSSRMLDCAFKVALSLSCIPNEITKRTSYKVVLFTGQLGANLIYISINEHVLRLVSKQLMIVSLHGHECHS